MQKILFGMVLCAASASLMATEQSTVDHYNRSCISCHASGVANAPKAFVESDWKPRLAKGVDVLLANVKKGINAMPPKGMCMDCTDADYRALIAYMSKPKQ